MHPRSSSKRASRIAPVVRHGRCGGGSQSGLVRLKDSRPGGQGKQASRLLPGHNVPSRRNPHATHVAIRRVLGGGAGMSLLEMTVVILFLLALISVLFIGARAWKRGSDRALCILHIQRVQKGVRGYSNLYGFSPGANVPGLQSQLIGLGCFVESTPVCPAGGIYSFGQTYGVNTIPPIGSLYMECSLAVPEKHVPADYSEW
jgi:hypothetical protein